MSARAKIQPFLDFVNSAFSVLSGAAAGTQASGWIRIIGVESIQFALSTTGTVAGTWRVQLATDFRGQDAIDLDPRYIQNSSSVQTPLPVPAGGALGPTVFQFVIPNQRYSHMQISFTLTGGAGNKQADTGLITSMPIDISKIVGGAAAWFYTPASSTHAGQASLDFAPFYYTLLDPFNTVPQQQADGTADLPPYMPALDSSNAAITIAAFVSGANSILKRLGALEVAAVRARYTPVSGFGRIKFHLNCKGMG